jgi:hypothetical protein
MPINSVQRPLGFDSSAHGDFHFYTKVAMWTLELGLVDKFVEVAPVARPRHPRAYGRKKSPEGVPFYT